MLYMPKIFNSQINLNIYFVGKELFSNYNTFVTAADFVIYINFAYRHVCIQIENNHNMIT